MDLQPQPCGSRLTTLAAPLNEDLYKYSLKIPIINHVFFFHMSVCSKVHNPLVILTLKLENFKILFWESVKILFVQST